MLAVAFSPPWKNLRCPGCSYTVGLCQSDSSLISQCHRGKSPVRDIYSSVLRVKILFLVVWYVLAIIPRAL